MIIYINDKKIELTAEELEYCYLGEGKEGTTAAGFECPRGKGSARGVPKAAEEKAGEVLRGKPPGADALRCGHAVFQRKRDQNHSYRQANPGRN